MKNRKPNEQEMLSRLIGGVDLLSPLVITALAQGVGRADRADARIEAGLPEGTERYRFVIEAKSQSTPQAVRSAVATARDYAMPDEQPMIMVPYLPPERLAELEREKVSGIDLCGNGVVIVPGRLFVFRTGQPNIYPDSRPLSNPYKGRSAMVPRMLLKEPRWNSLSELAAAIEKTGVKLSLPQASKAVQAMGEDLMVTKSGGAIALVDPLRLLDKLGSEWRKPWVRATQALRLPTGMEWAQVLSSDPLLKWATTGESSVTRYAMFSQGGPRRIAVSSLPLAMTLLGDGIPESVPNFADLILVETDEPGFFFDNETDEKGVRWASRLQTWLELQSGDARQQDAAKDVRDQILKGVQS